jgi:hypothetical protein
MRLVAWLVLAMVNSKPEQCRNSPSFYGAAPHVFYLKDTRTPTKAIELCVPQKNGNRNFAGFAYYARHHTPPKNAQNVLHAMNNEPLFDVGENAQGKLRGRVKKYPPNEKHGYADVYILARNPYARVLSQFLNHKADGCVDSSCKLSISKGTRPEPTPQYFERYVSDSMKERDATTTCKRDHHLCSQTLICAPRCVESPTILKLERQEAWWDGFVNATGVDRSGLVGESWRGFSGAPAFYERPSAAGRATAVGHVHATNATARLAELYTPEAAALVTATYADDFAAFGYCAGYACIARGQLD